jgi:serine/threonine protein kinase
VDETRTSRNDQRTSPACLLGEKYRVERVIGEGAFGRVYLATDTRLRRLVAIKELLASREATPPEVFHRFHERFEREARAGGAVMDPHIVVVHGMETDPQGNTYLVMEYVDGTNLRDLLVGVQALPPERATAIALDIARGLAVMHEAGIVHRDLKPANVMISRRGRAKIGDFGVAQVGDESQRTRTESGHPGTPRYMSPEQSTGTGYLDGRSDLYSLGLILYEMLAGAPYIPRQRPLADVAPATPPALAAIAERLLQPAPDRRFQNAADVVARLAALPVDTGISSGEHVPYPQAGEPQAETVIPTRLPPASLPPSMTRPPARRAVRAVTMVGAVVAVSLAAFLSLVFVVNRGGGVATTSPLPASPLPRATVEAANLPATSVSSALSPATAPIPSAMPSPRVASSPTGGTLPGTPRPTPVSPRAVKLTPGTPLPTVPLPGVFVGPRGLYTFHYPQDAQLNPPGRAIDAQITLDGGLQVSVGSYDSAFRFSDQELANILISSAGPGATVTEATTVKIAGRDGVRLRYTATTTRGATRVTYAVAFATDSFALNLLAGAPQEYEGMLTDRIATLDAIAGSFTVPPPPVKQYAEPQGRFSYQYPEQWAEGPPANESQLGRVEDPRKVAAFNVGITPNLGSLSLGDYFDRNLQGITDPTYGPKRYMRISDGETTIGGIPARFIVFTADPNDDGVLREIHQWLLIKDGMGYTLTFRTPADKAGEFQDVGDVIASTFTLP